jgi:hypothetical protein
MQVIGNRATQAFSAESDIREWSNSTTLNPSRITAERRDDPAVGAAVKRYLQSADAGMSRMAELAGIS